MATHSRSGAQAGDVLEIYHAERPSKRCYLKLNSTEKMKGVNQVSVRKDIADMFDFQAVREVVVKRVDPEMVAIDFMELIIKDQYIMRCDMLRLKDSLVDQCVYKGKKLSYLGVKVSVVDSGPAAGDGRGS